MKKSLLRIACGLFAVSSVLSADAYSFVADNVYYDIITGTTNCKVTYKDKKYNSYSGDVVIPEKVIYNGQTYTVTETGDYCMRNCSDLTSVKLPSTLVTVGKGTFSKCSLLTSVDVPASVTTIATFAFNDCPKLEQVTLHEGVKTIESNAFLAVVSMKSITIPQTVTEIGGWAFKNCVSLTEFNVPANVASIGNNAFQGCVNMANINVAADNAAYSSIDGVLFNKDKTVIIAYPGGRTATSYTIPDGVKEIGFAAFNQHSITVAGSEVEDTFLATVNIPETVTILGNSAFEGLVSMKEIAIPKGVTKVGNATFRGCRSLESVDIPDAVTLIDSYAFKGCEALKSATIGSSVATVNREAFAGCTALTSIVSNAVTPPAASKAFVDEATYTAATLQVPDGSVDDYKAAAFWSNFTQIKSAGVNDVITDATAVPVEYYDLRGIRYSEPRSGLNIVRMSDGSVRKVRVVR